MSFAMTTKQVREETKDVTRRFGWGFLKPGDRVWAVEKAMGLKKGEKINRLKMIEVISISRAPLNSITQDDVRREGFPDWTPSMFVDMLVRNYRCEPGALINRIEYRYVDPSDVC